jgi:hypothetical protein
MVDQKKYWQSIFFKRKQYNLNLADITSLKLRETDSGNRLTIDKGAERIELGSSATEVEREWLYEYLHATYF